MPEPKATIGQRLKNIRVERRLSIEKAAEATRIRVPYLQALEEDNYSVMASAAQGRGFLKIYAGYLDLDLDAAMQDLQRADDSAEVPPAAASPESVAVAPAPDAPPPAPSEPTADRRPFWARLLRRSAPEADAAPLPKPAATEEPVPAPPEPEPEPLSQSRPEPEQTLVSVKKTAAKKPRSAAKVSKSKGGTAEADTKKPAGKKKGPLKKPSAKK